MNKTEHQNRHFQTVAKEYYTARQNKNHLLFKKLLFGWLLRDISFPRDRILSVLEPMCGYAEGRSIVMEHISPHIRYEGFDFNGVLIGKVKDQMPGVHVYRQDVTTFSTDRTYDLIILLGGLHHVPDFADRICANLADALKPDGLLISLEPTDNNGLTALIRSVIYKKNHIFDEQTERAFSLKELRKIYHDAGLMVYRQYYPGLFGYVLYYNPDAFPALNIGNKRMVRTVFHAEKYFYDSFLGRLFSFCTFTVLKKRTEKGKTQKGKTQKGKTRA